MFSADSVLLLVVDGSLEGKFVEGSERAGDQVVAARVVQLRHDDRSTTRSRTCERTCERGGDTEQRCEGRSQHVSAEEAARGGGIFCSLLFATACELDQASERAGRAQWRVGNVSSKVQLSTSTWQHRGGASGSFF